MDAAHDLLLRRVEQFIYREARLQDEHAYEAWEALWDEDGVYWVPANDDDIDPDEKMSVLYDNRSRIRIRVRQLMTGKRHTQEPQSRLRRLVSNIEAAAQDDGLIAAGCNQLVFESNLRGETIWAARTEYLLRPGGDSFLMARKKVSLVNNDQPLYTLSFLI